jgi:hypothetical protein
MKIADPVSLNMYMRENGKVQHSSCPQYSILYIQNAGLNDSEGPEKYNNTEVKSNFA